MTTSVGEPESAASRFVEFDEFIDYQLTKTTHGIRMTDVLTGAVGAALGICLYVLLFTLFDHWIIPGGFGFGLRMTLWLAGIAGLLSWLMLRLVRPYRRRVNSLYAARRIEKAHPDLKSSLLTLVNLRGAGRPMSARIRGSLEKRAAVGLSHADIDHAIDRQTLMQCSYALLGVLAVIGGYALFSPKSIAQSAWRAVVPFTGAAAVTRTRIDRIAPGDIEVAALSQVDVEVELSGVVPPEVTLLYTTADRRYVDEPVALRDTGEGLRRYRGTLLGEDARGLRQSLSYRVRAGDALSESYAVRVVQPPTAIVDEIRLDYPPYTGLASHTESGGAIDAWEGTRVTLQARTNMPVSTAMLLFSDSEDTTIKAEELPVQIAEGTRLTATWQLAFRTDGTFPKFYRIAVRNDAGHFDPQPALHPIRIRPDLPPKLELVSPRGDVHAPANGVVAIAYRAADPDFRLRSVVLHVEREGQALPNAPRLFSGPPDQAAVEGVHRLQLSDFNPAPGSRLTWWLEARDNLEPFGSRGVNRTVTPKMNIQILDPQPPQEAEQQAAAEEQKAQDALDRANQTTQGDSETETDDPRDAGADRDSSTDGDDDDDPARPGDERMPSDDGEQSGAAAADPSSPDAPERGEDRQAAEEGDDAQDAAEQNPREAGEKGGTTDSENGQAGEGQKTRPGQNADPNGDQAVRQPSNRNGQTGGQQRASRPSGGDPANRDRTPDDKALQRLIDWERRQRENDPGDPSENGEGPRDETQRPTPSAGERRPGDNRAADDPGRENTEGDDAGQDRTNGGERSPRQDSQRPGERSTGERSTDRQDENRNGTGAEPSEPGGDPSASDAESKGGESSEREAGTRPEEAPRERGRNEEPRNGDADRADSPSRGSDPSADRGESMPPGDTPTTGDAERPDAGAPRPGARGDDERPGDPMTQPPGEAASRPDGEGTSPPTTDGTPGDQRDSGGDGMPPGGDRETPTGETGAPPSGEQENSTASGQPADGGASRDPMTSDNASAGRGEQPANDQQPQPNDRGQPPAQPPGGGDRTTSPDSTSSNSGDSRESSQGEATSGQSTGRNQSPNQSSRTNENRGTGSQQPTGQADEGARSGGEGNPGSSTAAESGDQTTPGEGEAGPGESSSSGQKTGSQSQSGGSQTGSNAKGGAQGEGGASPSGDQDSAASESGATADRDSSATPGPMPGREGEPERSNDRQGAGGENASQGGGGAPKNAGESSAPGQNAPGESPSGDSPSSDSASGESDSGDSANADSPNGGQSSSGGEISPEGSGQSGGGGEGGQEGESGAGSSDGGGGSESKAGSGGEGSAGTNGAGGMTRGGASNRGEGGPGRNAAAADAPGGSDPVNLEHKKRAADLALKRLQETLKRGQLDPELQQELGFTDDELADFMQRLEDRLQDSGDDQSIEARTRRRQFDTLLEALRIDSSGESRGGGDGTGPAASGFSAPQRPAPPELRAAETKYRQRLSQPRPSR
ncbi:MAG: hypothetical protein KF774_09890 [Planctomyces sp.]|nr:hypothetical protein [Planctomyces sp.]